MAVKLYIGADIVPKASNMRLFEAGDAEALLGQELFVKLSSADFISLNLEIPLTDQNTPIVKCGPVMSCEPKAINGLAAINPCFYTLANNHIMDHGSQGLVSTMKLLDEKGIRHAGAGKNLKEASTPFCVSLKGINIGVYCCAEHEFSIASDDKPGANPYDPLISFDAVKELSSKCDYVIVLYHGGKEQYQYPSPQLQRVFRKFADCGANLVIAQHTHCIGCKENYHDALLVYGQGNFLYDLPRNELWKQSLLIEVQIDEGTRQASCKFIPVVLNDGCIRAAQDHERNEILTQFEIRSSEILKDGFLADQYLRLAQSESTAYFRKISGLLGTILQALPGKAGKCLLLKNYKKKYWPGIINTMECETHRELFLDALKDIIDNKA